MNTELKQFLDEKYEQYRGAVFIENDPILIPHRFSKKEDIEVAGFLTATIAWGQRKSIIRSAERLSALMEGAPYDFLLNSREQDLEGFKSFVHRTFQGTDCHYFISRLRQLYQSGSSLESVFTKGYELHGDIGRAITYFRDVFFRSEHLLRTEKHISNPAANAAAKRLNMFLRWMVRDDDNSVDFGIWQHIPASALMCPLDVHTSAVSKKLGLLKRKQPDWKAVVELTGRLRELEPEDPVKYDIPLFALGAFEGF